MSTRADDEVGPVEVRTVANAIAASEPGATGSGLGLAIVQRLAHADQAAVKLRNRSGGGLEAAVVYPASAERPELAGHAVALRDASA